MCEAGRAAKRKADGVGEQASAGKAARAAAGAQVPCLGDRIEVKWTIEEDGAEGEEARVETHWWGATVHSSGGGGVHTLRYDEKGQFAPVDVQVRFKGAHTLWDLEVEEALAWRAEGSDAEPEPDDGEDGAAFTMGDVLTGQDELDRQQGEGETLEGLGMRALSTLPMDKQQRLAEGYRVMADKLKGHLQALVESKGAGHVVTAEDIHSIVDDIKQEGRA
mmetsp:Transcript_13348/g.46167  ORF Transcript_13348/g.46167 Transcript_13348/m.46167 type:complete len:220 (-) Transcript_13348:137-796(-)